MAARPRCPAMAAEPGNPAAPPVEQNIVKLADDFTPHNVGPAHIVNAAPSKFSTIFINKLK
jgi:hypothetical protein